MKALWQPAADAPRDAWPLAISVRLTCTCGYGGIVVLSAARRNGEWIIEDFEHSFEITHFYTLPEPPVKGMN